jgi:hypothetical protein
MWHRHVEQQQGWQQQLQQTRQCVGGRKAAV